MFHKVALQPELAAFVDREFAPILLIANDGDVDELIRVPSLTVSHPIGNCRMGTTSHQAFLVNSAFLARGIGNSRSADASIMPNLIGGDMIAVPIMIAGKAAELLMRKLSAIYDAPQSRAPME